MKKQRIFAVVMAAVMTLSLVACGEKQTGNDVTPTTAPTTAPTEAPAQPTEAPAPQNVTIADASITFEDGNMGFVDAYMSHARSANVELSIVDFNGSKALKVVNTTGTSKAPFVAIDASSFLGADVAKVAGVEMVIGTSSPDGKFHAVSGEIGSWWGAKQEKNVLGSWSVYMAKKNPKVITGAVPAGNELVADAFNIVYVGMTTDNAATDEGVCSEFYIDDIRFFDAAGNTLKGDTTVAFNWPAMDEVDYSIYKLSNVTEFDGYVSKEGAWTQAGADFTQELLDALVPGTALEIDFKSEDNTMWAVFPDATAGWSRIAQGAAVINDSGSKAQITYEQIVAVVGEDKANWGARLQFEAQTAWEVYGIRVGTYGKNTSMANPVAFDGYVCKEGAWTQAGADFTQELLDAIVPGTAVKVSYKSEDGTMWLVFPDATAGWSRIAQGTAVCDGETAYITYDQIVAVVGEDKANWGARLQFEAQTAWEVYGIEVGAFVEYPIMGSFVDFDGYAAKEGAWTQAGADFTTDLLAALTPGSIMEISYKSEDGTMWVVLPDAAAGWSRCAQGTAICTGDKAYVTYEQIAAVVGDDQSQWGARLQFESQTAWEVYAIRVGKYVVEETADEGGEEEPAATAPDPTIQVADGDVAYTSSKTFSDGTWWTQEDVSLVDLVGDLDPTSVTAIEFTCPDTNFIVGYNDTISGAWAQFDTSNTYVVKTCNFEGTDPIVCLYLSKADNVEYTISWKVYVGGSTDIVASEEPAVEIPAPVITAADGKGSVTAIAEDNWWTQIGLTKDELLAGATEGTIKLYADTAFAIGYNDATPTWVQFDGQTSYEVPVDGIDWGEGYFFCVVLRDGDMAEHTINWEVVSAGGAAAEEPAGDNLVITFADLTAGGYGYNATVNGDVVDVTIASQYQEIQYILPEAVDLAAYKTLIVDVTSNAQLDIKLVDPNAELNQYNQKAPFKDNYTAEGQAITEPIYIDLAEFADKDLSQINFMAMGADTAFTIKSITFVK
ncbi:MAG: hypothetical protein IJ420_09590 [Lachnospiraceae bacterium]|nr:hypothetical protein [Lachnospiraceae bacterium]